MGLLKWIAKGHVVSNKLTNPYFDLLNQSQNKETRVKIGIGQVYLMQQQFILVIPSSFRGLF